MQKTSNFTRVGSFVILVCMLVGCGTGSTADSATDAKRWQGTWKLIACTYDGEPQMADMGWIVEGDHYRIRLDGRTNEDLYVFKLDAIRNRIDVFHHDTPPGTIGGKLKGIYKIDGDSLIVCYDLTEQGYPGSFAAQRGSRRVLYEFRRA